MMTIRDLQIGQSARIEEVGGEGALRQHFLDMGVIPGATVTLVKLAPMGDPMELRIHGYELTLRLADAEKITATLIEKKDASESDSYQDKEPKQKSIKNKEKRQDIEHPGRKLIFMGQDLGEPDSWHESREVEWYLLDNENHAKLQHMIADIHKLYLTNPALYANDDEEMTFEWVDSMNAKNARITFYRHGIDSHGKKQTLFVLCNFANVMKILQIGVPKKGTYKEIFNTDKEQYGGTGFVNPRAKKVVEKKADGHPYSIKMNMPPLSVLLFSYTEE